MTTPECFRSGVIFLAQPLRVMPEAQRLFIEPSPAYARWGDQCFSSERLVNDRGHAAVDESFESQAGRGDPSFKARHACDNKREETKWLFYS